MPGYVVHLPESLNRQVRAIAAARGVTKGEMIARMVAERVAEIAALSYLG